LYHRDGCVGFHVTIVTEPSRIFLGPEIALVFCIHWHLCMPNQFTFFLQWFLLCPLPVTCLLAYSVALVPSLPTPGYLPTLGLGCCTRRGGGGGPGARKYQADSGRDWTLVLVMLFNRLETGSRMLELIFYSQAWIFIQSCFGGRSAVNNCHLQCLIINYPGRYTGPSNTAESPLIPRLLCVYNSSYIKSYPLLDVFSKFYLIFFLSIVGRPRPRKVSSFLKNFCEWLRTCVELRVPT
jgi:hypothetical protein